MILSSLSRNLPRTTAAAASTRIRPAFSIVASTHLRRPPPLSPPTRRRPAFLLPRASFASGSGYSSDDDDDDDDDDGGKEDSTTTTTDLRVDAIADIIAAEHSLKLPVSRKIIATVFATIAEVRCCIFVSLRDAPSRATPLRHAACLPPLR